MARELHYWEYVALEEAELQKKEAELQKSEISEAGLCSQFGQVALVDEEEKATSTDKENNPDQITNSGKEDSVSYKTPARSYSPRDRVYNNNCYSSSSSYDSTPTKSYNNSLETPPSLTPEEKDAQTKERILQISNFPFSFKRNDFYEVFTTCKNVIFSRHGIALVVFPTKSLARVAYTKALSLPVLEEFEIAPFTGELPYELKAYAGRDATRPKTSDLVARRLIGKSLGKTIGTEEENRRKQVELDEARRKRVKEREETRELEKD